MPEDLLDSDGCQAFESISSLASSLCEIIIHLESQAMHYDKSKASCFLLTVSVVGNVVNMYYKMSQSLNHRDLATTQINLHHTLQLLANADTMKFQLIYMQRICQRLHEEFGTSQIISRIDTIREVLQRNCQLLKAKFRII